MTSRNTAAKETNLAAPPRRQIIQLNWRDFISIFIFFTLPGKRKSVTSFVESFFLPVLQLEPAGTAVCSSLFQVHFPKLEPYSPTFAFVDRVSHSEKQKKEKK